MKPWFLTTPIAHRGFHHGTKVPENSLAAFEEACQKGYAIEIDCHYHVLSGEIIVFHDDDLIRMACDARSLQELSLHELKQTKLYETDQCIPTLDEVLELVAGRVPLLIETKQHHSNGQFEAALMAKMESYQGEWAVQSFHHGALYWFEKNYPHVVKGMLSGSMEGVDISTWKKLGVNSMAMLPLVRPQFIAYEAQELVRLKKGLTWQKVLGTPVIAWTVRSLKEYKAVKGLCDNIIFENFIPEP